MIFMIDIKYNVACGKWEIDKMLEIFNIMSRIVWEFFFWSLHLQ